MPRDTLGLESSPYIRNRVSLIPTLTKVMTTWNIFYTEAAEIMQFGFRIILQTVTTSCILEFGITEKVLLP